MEITINDKTQSVSNGDKLLQAVEKEIGLNTKGIAVALNETVIPKSEWSKVQLQNNDQIIIIKATQGG